jgi:predicted Zn-dependent peptidase
LLLQLEATSKDFAAERRLIISEIREDNQRNEMQLLDSPDDLNWVFAYENHIIENKYADISSIVAAYQQTTAEQLVKTANKIFSPNNALIVSIGNKKGLSETKLHETLLQI